MNSSRPPEQNCQTKPARPQDLNTFVERPFISNLSDAIGFLALAERGDVGRDSDGILARGSILNCVFALESAANCCLEAHPYPKTLREKLDSLATLDKFEFVLASTQKGAALDRGCLAVQAVQELITMRNRYVHPKSRKGDLILEAVPEGYMGLRDKRYPITQILNRPMNWRPTDARRALEYVVAFLNCFFLDWCKFSVKAVERLLVCSSTFDTDLLGHGKRWATGMMFDAGFAELARHAKLTIRFFDLDEWLRGVGK